VAARAARSDLHRASTGRSLNASPGLPAHRPRKRFGQHFLRDRAVIERIVAAIAPAADDLLLEIGPGDGALTAALAARVRHLDVVEIDRDLAARLAGDYDPARLTVHNEDALDLDLGRLPRPLRVVGNLPYNISTPLLFHLLAQADRIRDMHFMLQREVVDRMVAAPSSPQYGRLSVMVQHRSAAVRLFTVPPQSFRPAPKVDSAMVRLIPRAAQDLGDVDAGRFAEVVTQAFSHRRKTLRNALASVIGPEQLIGAGVDPGSRPENLSFEDYRRLARTPDQRDPALSHKRTLR